MGIKQIIAIASAKGGVGKSTICTNLAFQFSKNVMKKYRFMMPNKIVKFSEKVLSIAGNAMLPLKCLKTQKIF